MRTILNTNLNYKDIKCWYILNRIPVAINQLNCKILQFHQQIIILLKQKQKYNREHINWYLLLLMYSK